ncbi:TetR/AcrR family transcriptional regulator [Herbiconiux moechotypicola]|uniref:TetR/AcrR family transcriptional regulator n=1 Tax=Herbiconiux moechotypicola TaxID=637393 RepID=A0ABN3E835_9MICO|nr:TetR/AcrR family transcriptional regulator [Herbiconiux moechotypicola]MCS5730728.1 TetR/AcrR family transcriptional regulator [Herbiconiux moechotypicola]
MPAKTNRGPVAGPANRRALISAARTVFAESGYDAPLNAVARRAGVGQGSLYRHFPDRVSLAVAVFDENIGELEAFARSKRSSLGGLIELVIEQAIVSTALIELTMNSADDERVRVLGERVAALVDEVVAVERDRGRIGAEVDSADVLLAISMLAAIVSRTPEQDRRSVAERAWALFPASFAVTVHGAGMVE